MSAAAFLYLERKERILALILKIYTNIFLWVQSYLRHIKKTKERIYIDSWFFPVSTQKVPTVPTILFPNLGVSVVTVISD